MRIFSKIPGRLGFSLKSIVDESDLENGYVLPFCFQYSKLKDFKYQGQISKQASKSVLRYFTITKKSCYSSITLFNSDVELL